MVLVSVVNYTLLELSAPKIEVEPRRPQSQKQLGHSFTPASGQNNTFLYTTSRNHLDSKTWQTVIVLWQLTSV